MKKSISIKELCTNEYDDSKSNWILVVDDSMTLRNIMVSVLESDGYQSKQACNGQEALEILKWETPELVLMDIEMPVMDGLQTLKEIRSIRKFDNLPIIMVTAEEKDAVLRVLAMGANDYVEKPFDSRELLARVGAHIRVGQLNKVQERLYRQSELYHQSYRNSNDAIVITDFEGVVLKINQSFTRLYGYEDQEIVGENIRTIFMKSMQEEIKSKMWDDIHDPDIGFWSGELENITKSKEAVSVILSITAIKNEDKIIGFMGVAVDITSRKRYEETLCNYNSDLENKVKERVHELEETQEATLIGLAKLAEFRDPETGEHLERIRNYTKIIAEELGKPEKYKNVIDEIFVDTIYKSSPLHDIGKVGIPDKILLKTDKLSKDEFEIMKKHTIIGAEAIEATQMRLKNRKNYFLEMGREIARFHHERWDGKGYPDGLKEEEIPLCARIMAIADVYDALVSKRVYKKAFTHKDAKEIILKDSGSHFDPDVIGAFLRTEDKFIAIKEKFVGE